MDLQRSYVFIVFIVMLIHQVVFSECDSKTKTYNRLTKSNVDGFQRKERQAPIDPSRMYLPPRTDSIASVGFGDHNIDASNNFGDNAAQGYGEIALVQDASATTGDGDSYNVPAKNAGDGTQGGGDGPPSSGQKIVKAALERNNFGRYLQQNKNAHYYGGGSSSMTGNDDELLSTAQNRGSTTGNNNYSYKDQSGSGVADSGSTVGFGQSVAGARKYGGLQGTASESSGYGAAGPSVPLLPRDNNRNGDDLNSKRAFSGQTTAGYGNTVPADSFGRDPATSYGQNRNTAATNYGQNGNTPAVNYQQQQQQFGTAYGNLGPSITDINDLQTGPPSQSATTSQTNSVSYDQDQWSSGGYQAGYNREETMESSAAAYGLSSSGGGFNQGTSPSNLDGGFGSNEAPQNQPRGEADNYGQAMGSIAISDGDNYYGHIPSADRSSAHNDRGGDGSSTVSSPSAFDRQSSDASYGPPGPLKSLKNGGNSDQNQSDGLANGGGYGLQTPSNGLGAGLDQSQRGTSQVFNNYGSIGYQSSQSGKNGYDQRSSTNGQNSYGPAGSQISPSTKDGYSQSLPTYGGGYTQGSPSPIQTSERNDYAQINTPLNGLPTRSSVQGGTGSSSGLGRPCHSPSGQNIGRNSLRSSSTRAPSDSQNQSQNEKKYSTVVPKAQYQNSNLPNNGNFEKQGNGLQNANSNGDYSEPGPNAFSNFAPDNEPNSPINLDDNKSNYGEPGSKALSNLVLSNQLNPPTHLDDNSNYGEPGSNAFSNFAPGNQLNPPINLNGNNGGFGEPGPNAFSNFAPGNQPNTPTNLNNNNCGTNNQNNNRITQYGSVFSASNTGY